MKTLRPRRYKRILTECRVCEFPLMVRPSRIKDGKGKYCSENCYNVIPKVQGFKKGMHKGIRRSPATEFQYKNGTGYRHLLIEGILQNKCTKCNENQISNLEVHHIDHDRKNNSIVNLQVLCRKHHLLHHGKIMGGKKK